MKYAEKFPYAVAAAAFSDSHEPVFVRRIKHGSLFVEKIWRGVTLGDRNAPPVCDDLNCDVLDEHHCNACLAVTGFSVQMKKKRITFRLCSEECLISLKELG